MTAANAIQAMPLCIGNGVLISPMMEPPPEVTSEIPKLTDDWKLPRHLRRGFAARLPIGFCGIVQGAPGEGSPYSRARTLYLYRDYHDLPRSFDLASHDREGVLSLFAGNEWLIARLWPARRGRWDPAAATETLIVQQSRVGLVHGVGFELIAEDVQVRRAHIAIGRLAARLLWRGCDPYQVLDLARGWNTTRGQGALGDETIEQIVDSACARELGFEELRRAG